MDGLTKEDALRRYQCALNERREAIRTHVDIHDELELKKKLAVAANQRVIEAGRRVQETLDLLNHLLGEPMPGAWCAHCDSTRCTCAGRYR